jgi:hypothetical protein
MRQLAMVAMPTPHVPRAHRAIALRSRLPGPVSVPSTTPGTAQSIPIGDVGQVMQLITLLHNLHHKPIDLSGLSRRSPRVYPMAPERSTA